MVFVIKYGDYNHKVSEGEHVLQNYPSIKLKFTKYFIDNIRNKYYYKKWVKVYF